MDLNTHIDLRDAEAGFRGMTRRAESRRRSFFESAKKPARDDLRQRQKDRRGPNGELWPSRAASTLERARRGGRKRSKSPSLLGRLPRIWKGQVSSDSLRMVNHARFAEVHDAGGTVGHGARLPARGFIGFTRGFIADVHETWAEFVLAGWERG